MAEMTARERVLSALNHQEPDRVPVALGGGPYGVVDALYFKLLQRFDLGDPVAPFRKGHNISYMDDRLFAKLGIDTRYVWPGASPSSPSTETNDPDTFLDGFGQPWKRALPYFYADKGVLETATSVDDIDRLLKWPVTTDPRWVKGVRERAQMLHDETNYFVAARMVLSHGLYQLACDFRGTEQFMIDLIENEVFAKTLIGRIADTIDGLVKAYMEAGGKYFNLIELPGDDYAGNTNLVMSPAMIRKYFKPEYARIIRTIKSYNPDIKVMFHSDGMIKKLLPELIDIGVDVVHPLEPLPAMNIPEIKAEFGQKISFLGGIDISHALPGSLEDVENEAKLRIQQLAPGGGYILAPANHIQADVPAENVVRLFETARKYGQYPIKVD